MDIGDGNKYDAYQCLPEVREKVFRIFRDVCMRYDVDGIEMDFFRHPLYFREMMLGEPVSRGPYTSVR